MPLSTPNTPASVRARHAQDTRPLRPNTLTPLLMLYVCLAHAVPVGAAAC